MHREELSWQGSCCATPCLDTTFSAKIGGTDVSRKVNAPSSTWLGKRVKLHAETRRVPCASWEAGKSEKPIGKV